MESTLAMGRRVRDAGLRWHLDFHYSDTWADPGHQTKPAAWAALDFPSLTNAVHDYTRDALLALVRQGTPPDMIQLGNEIGNGLLRPDGAAKNPAGMTALLRAAVRAARETLPGTPTMLHVANGGDSARCRAFFDACQEGGVDFDVIGVSFYRQHHGTPMDLHRNLLSLVALYRRPVVVVEHSRDSIRDVHAIVRALPDGMGWGAFIWEPTDPGHGNLFDAEGLGTAGLKDYDWIKSWDWSD
jgi:arabinogalactan endo-1,4-beta-galactosidase